MSDPIATTPGGRTPTVPVEAPTAGRPSRGRSIAAVVCVVLAALLMTPAAVAYWGQRTLNDSQRYVNTVGPLVNSPQVQDVLATKVTGAIQQQVDIEAILNDVFAGVITDRPRLQRLVGPLSAAINGLIDRQVREFIASDAFAELWTAANTRAQQSLHRLLTGDESGAVSLQGDQVVLDVSEVIDRVKQRLVDRGLTIVEKVPIPDTDKQIVLMEAPQLKQLRTIYAFANPLAQWLIVVVAALYLAALLLARRRPRMTVIIGALVAANALLVALALSVGRQLFVDQLAGTDFGPASRIFYDTLLSYLDRGWQVFLWLGLILVVVGWFAGPNRSGTAVRTAVTGGLEGIGQALADTPVGGAGAWTATNARWLRVVIGALGVVVLLWGNDVSPSRLFWSLALVILLLALVQVLVGAGRESATSRPAPPTQTAPAGTG
ncbi:hypothetical protein [Kribbella sp. VKM Ac-2568]|uniref:hypothetical protein n=1 Tax=Kribbella sp. VKM Ac-2568 TaxID=2512219 RepID=UPI001050E13D|nr:hypothetical protein [Kribbella sp. VKM Ac-2568]TCM38524.1 hypothetical protein EV648_11638 [Kribbella sp. VKM Ac-2568]